MATNTGKVLNTENKALSYPADDPLLELFFKALRNTPEPQMRKLVRNAWTGARNEDYSGRRLHTPTVPTRRGL